MVMLPLSVFSKPAIALSSVVLPQPLGPSRQIEFAFFDLERYVVESLECAVVLYVLFAYAVYFDKCH